MHTYIDTYSSCHIFIHVYTCTYMLFLYATTSAEVTREQRRKRGSWVSYTQQPVSLGDKGLGAT